MPRVGRSGVLVAIATDGTAADTMSVSRHARHTINGIRISRVGASASGGISVTGVDTRASRALGWSTHVQTLTTLGEELPTLAFCPFALLAIHSRARRARVAPVL